MASWYVSAFDLWVAAGGQDPRWPALMQSQGNREVWIVAQQFEGVGGSDYFLQQYIKFIYEQLEDRRIRDYWPEFPVFKFVQGLARSSNGSHIRALPEGEHKSRGGGATLIHDEEFSAWKRAAQTLNIQRPCVKSGGHIILVQTPVVGSYAAKIRNDELDIGVF